VGAVIPGIAELLGEEEDVDGVRAATVRVMAWFARWGWSVAQVNDRRRSCCGQTLWVVVVRLVHGCSHATNCVSRVRREKRELEEEEWRREEAGAHQNQQRELPAPTGFGEGIRRPGGKLRGEKERGSGGGGGLYIAGLGVGKGLGLGQRDGRLWRAPCVRGALARARRRA
jgi:hypothetical protein